MSRDSLCRARSWKISASAQAAKEWDRYPYGHNKKINVSHVFTGQTLGIKEVEENTWLVSFMDYYLGYIDLEEKCLQPLETPFSVIKV